MHVLLKMGPGVKINQNQDGNVGMLLKINTFNFVVTNSSVWRLPVARSALTGNGFVLRINYK